MKREREKKKKKEGGGYAAVSATKSVLQLNYSNT